MHVSWRIFVDAQSAKSAGVLLDRVAGALQIRPEAARIEPYHKGGFVLEISCPLADAPWSEVVVGLLARAQQVATSWELSGSILEELNAWSIQSRIAGVKSLHLQCQRGDEA